jgi:hypothetical protein
MSARPCPPLEALPVLTRRAPILIALVLVVLVASPVAAGDTVRERSKEHVARGVFDPLQGCVAWLVNVSPSLDKSGTGSVFLAASAVNDCTGDDVIGVSGTFPLEAAAFAIGGDLEAASLATTVVATDRVSGLPMTVTIDLGWAATGDPPTRTRFREVTEDAGQRTIVKTERVSFPASAAGTITIGERALALRGPLLADLSEVETETTVVADD